MFSRGLAVKIKQRNVFVAEEVIFFFLVLLCVLFFVAIEVNTGMFAH